MFWTLTLAAALAAPAPPAAPAAASNASPKIGDVLARTGRATGYRGLDFAITETGEDGNASTRVFSKAGRIRSGTEFGFDGAVAWQTDSRRGYAVPMNLRQFEKQAWPLWVRSGQWLDPASGVAATILPGESDSRRVALRLERKGGVIPATLYIDRATWLPERLVVAYDRGPFTAVYSDYRRVLGRMLPHRIESSYRGSSVSLVSAVRPLGRGEGGFAMAHPIDYSFDNRAPALLSLRRGTPVAVGDPGHVYARPAIDGREQGWFLFDSGADGMMIDTKIADSLEMPIIGRTNSIGADGNPRPGTFRRGKSFRLGRLTIENPVYLALDLGANNAPAGEKRAGVIGYDVLARAVVEYSGTGDKVALCDPGRYRAPARARWQALHFIDSTPAVWASAEDRRQALFQVDTGSAATVDFYPAYTVREKLLEGRQTRSLRSQGAGGSFAVEVGRLAGFDFAGKRFRNVEVSFRTGGIGRDGGAGVIGRELMAGFTTIFDYSRRRIAFAPLAAGGRSCGQ